MILTLVLPMANVMNISSASSLKKSFVAPNDKYKTVAMMMATVAATIQDAIFG